jgi:hypothetical protein
MPDRPHWIFQVIQQAEAKHQVELPKLHDLPIFNIPLGEWNPRKAPSRLDHILQPAIKPFHLQSRIFQQRGEKPSPQPTSRAVARFSTGFNVASNCRIVYPLPFSS